MTIADRRPATHEPEFCSDACEDGDFQMTRTEFMEAAKRGLTLVEKPPNSVGWSGEVRGRACHMIQVDAFYLLDDDGELCGVDLKWCALA